MQHLRAQIGRPARKSGLFIGQGPSWNRFFIALVVSMWIGALMPAAIHARSTPVAEPAASSGNLDAAVSWLVTQQHASGAFIGFSGEPDPGTTIDAVLALAAATTAPADALALAANYLTENASTIVAQGDGVTAKLVLALLALGHDPSDVNGINLIESLTGAFDDDDGLCGLGVYDHALCMLALAGAGAPPQQASIDTLVSFQIENGGWAFDGSREVPMADSNTTAIVIQALIAAGVAPDQEPVQRALGYLSTVVAAEGGFAYAVADPLVPDANSTAIVIQALIAAGEDPGSAEWGNAQAALGAFQNPSGAFRYMRDMPDDNLFATLQAIPALVNKPLPISAG